MGDKQDMPALGTLGRALTVALEAVLSVPEMRTRDLGGTLGTKAFGAAVAERIEAPNG